MKLNPVRYIRTTDMVKCGRHVPDIWKGVANKNYMYGMGYKIKTRSW